MRPHLPFLFVLLAYTRAEDHTNHTIDATGDVAEQKTNATKEILKASETADPGNVEIVKQIRRLNDDGSYTIGYEADDGTFKIESRDVLGNVKGTFGYIDKDGEIKRVTYSSSSDGTPVPMTTSTTPLPTTTMRMNKTVSSTTRRPQLSTVVYPKGSYTTRGTVIQPIPRRRIPVPSSTRQTTKLADSSTTTEKQKVEETTSNILNLYKSKTEDIKTMRIQTLKPVVTTSKEDLLSKQSSIGSTTKTPYTPKPVYEHVNEKAPEKDANKANPIRRELSGTGNPNPHMLTLQQSAGDDSTDVYGSHLSLGTARPLFTTTTPRARLVPIHSLVAARQKIQQQYQDIPIGEDEQETTIEASTGRIFDHENVVTSNPVPVIHIPSSHRDQGDERIYQPIYTRQPAAVHFRTNEYLRDNPGAAIPIGNQRPFLSYEYQPQPKVLEPQFIKETSPPPQAKAAAHESVTVAPYDIRPVTRIVPIAVDERGVPIRGYQARFVNPYRQTTQQQPPPVVLQPRVVEPEFDDMNSISTPVSTRDLKRLLHVLIYRQNRLQALMDQIIGPGPPYQHDIFRQANSQQQHYNEYGQRNNVVGYQNAMNQRHYPQEEERFDYRYDQQQYRQQSQQQDLYTNQIASYDSPQYDSQRFVPRRRLYTRPTYDTASASSSQIQDGSEYLPPEIREALLLKMLMLAINPDYMPTPAPITELTTAAPARKQVRNVQILGEEGSMDDAKRKMQRH